MKAILRPWARSDVPLVWRSDSCIEMGWPPRQVRVDNVDAAHVAWLLGLHADATMAEALKAGRSAGLAPSSMRSLVRAAAHCGLLDDASALPEALRDTPLAVRDALACDIAAARFIYGPQAHTVINQRRAATVAVNGSGLLADVVVEVLTSAGIGSIVRERSLHSGSRRHRQSAARHACHVVCDAAHPDAASDVDSLALEIPHLSVSAAAGQAVIGPLVVPGRTSCLRCRDLHLADADPTWSRAAVQWSARKPASVAGGLAYLAGSWAALQVLALVDAGPHHVSVPTLDGALVITLPAAQPTWEARPAHPLCGCRWPHTGRGMSA